LKKPKAVIPKGRVRRVGVCLTDHRCPIGLDEEQTLLRPPIPASDHPRTRSSQVDPVPRPTAALVPLVAGLKFLGRDGPTKPTYHHLLPCAEADLYCTCGPCRFTVPSREREGGTGDVIHLSVACASRSGSVLTPHTRHLILIAPPSAHRFSWQLRVAPTIHRHQPSAAPPATRTPFPGERWRRS
jgi:hypothetical protein